MTQTSGSAFKKSGGSRLGNSAIGAYTFTENTQKLQNLQLLSLLDNFIKDNGVRAIIESMPNLVFLEFTGNCISDAEAANLTPESWIIKIYYCRSSRWF